MAIAATQTVTTPIAATPPKEAVKTAEAKQPQATPTTGDSVAQATPTETQAKKVDVTA